MIVPVQVLVDLWSGGGWGGDPGAVAVEEAVQGLESGDAPVRGGGEVGLDDGEVGESLQCAPGSAGRSLLDLDGSDLRSSNLSRGPAPGRCRSGSAGWLPPARGGGPGHGG